MRKHFICFHLFNDYCGSPKVLRMVLERMLREGHRVDLVTSRGGVLDELQGREGLRIHHYAYRFSRNPVVTMVRYALVQLMTFCWAFRWRSSKDTVFYINTLLPVGPALAGRLTGKRVVYHYHENASAKGAFYRLLAALMQRLAHQIVCVSDYQASFLQRRDKVTVVPNALSREFLEKLHPNAEAAFERKTVLMLSSLKAYKGTMEFIEMSLRMPAYAFVLVINDTSDRIEKYLADHQLEDALESNLIIYPRQTDVTGFYNEASVVVNLSDKERFVETFGLTALEAMAAGLPVIVPTEGGIAEMVEDGENGYKIDVAHIGEIETRIKELFSDRETYLRMADNALRRAARYDAERMTGDIEALL